MLEPPLPPDEEARIAALRFLEILDTEAEECFDRITALARDVLDVPICIVSLVDTDRQWFKSCQGLPASETTREVSFCGHTILQEETLIVEDATRDERFADNPLVSGDPEIRFYAGHPIRSKAGLGLGSLCVIDRKPRRMSDQQLQILQSLARMVQNEIQARETVRHHVLNLERANRAIVEATENRARFLTDMSHEIRTPMMSILGYVDLLSRNEASETEREEYASTIKASGSHLLALVNDILDHSKFAAGQMTVERLPVDLPDLLFSIERLLRIQSGEKGLSLSVSNVAPIPTLIETDPVRLRQILVNLTMNAIKFTESGSVNLEVRIEEDDGDPVLAIAIRDTGLGMTATQLARIFDPFVQAEADTTRRFGGTGLGLTISRQLAELLGGSIQVESRSGVGTTFTLRIDPGPVTGVPWIDSLENPAGNRDDEGSSSPQPGDFDGRVLIAEDDAINRKLMVKFMERYQVDHETVAEGKAALETALEAQEQGRPFSLVLMDMLMPVIDGYTATSRLRDAGFRGAIVALTGKVQKEDRTRCLATGCDDYLTKPVDRKAVESVLSRFARG